MFIRKCKKCGNDVFHKSQENLNRALKLNKVCVSCTQKECKSGHRNGMYGKKHSDETKKLIREKRKLQTISKETRDKMSITHKKRLEEYNHWLGKKHSIKTKEKMRIISSKRIFENKWHPSFNIRACDIIEEYGKANGYNFRHALNGGEYFIEELGYWVDGYDELKNVVIEFYETAHKYFVEHDEIRIEKIKNHLNCEVIILKEWEL